MSPSSDAADEAEPHAAEDDAPTRPRSDAASRERRPASVGSADTTLAPTIALRDADTHRSIRAYAGASLICAAGVVGTFLVPTGDQLLRWITAVLVAAAGAFTGWLAFDRWRGGLFTDAEALTALVLMAAAALSAVAYSGPITAPAAVLVILVAGLAQGNERRGRLVFVVLTVGYGILVALVLAGKIPAMMNEHLHEDPWAMLTIAIVIELLLVVGFWFGIAARRSTERALASVQQARIELAGREALLQEARADLDRVAKGAAAGRLTGERIDDYVVGEIIGRGAMGEVYAASSPKHRGEVAMKVLHPNLVTDSHLVRRFFREAQVCSDLSSPHVVRVLGFGHAPDGSPFLVMERIVGQTLSALLRARGALDPTELADLLKQVCSGLAAAHAAGVIHRDIKPSNLMLVDGEPRRWTVLDFGISKLLGSGTLTGDALIGTPGFMAPEQAFGRDVDERADVFALGAVAYRALTGVPAFAGKDAMAIVMNAAQRQPPSPQALVDMPEDVELVLALALAKDREDRLASAEELSSAFARAFDGALEKALVRRGRSLLARMPWSDALSDAPPDEREGGTMPVS